MNRALGINIPLVFLFMVCFAYVASFFGFSANLTLSSTPFDSGLLMFLTLSEFYHRLASVARL